MRVSFRAATVVVGKKKLFTPPGPNFREKHANPFKFIQFSAHFSPCERDVSAIIPDFSFFFFAAFLAQRLVIFTFVIVAGVFFFFARLLISYKGMSFVDSAEQCVCLVWKKGWKWNDSRKWFIHIIRRYCSIFQTFIGHHSLICILNFKWEKMTQ